MFDTLGMILLAALLVFAFLAGLAVIGWAVGSFLLMLYRWAARAYRRRRNP
jgi:hypothetical protein